MNGKLIFLLIALLGAAFYLQSSTIKPLSIPSSTIEEWRQWKHEFGKTYGTPDIEAFRINIFYENILHYEQVNSVQNEYTLGLNQFSDLTQQEFIDTYLGFKQQNTLQMAQDLDFILEAVNADVDWRTQGAVTPVKNQGQCGSCWAFSSTGALEGLHKIKQGTLESYSEQQLVDCSKKQGNQGCNGGLMDNAFKYVKANGIVLESEYPYTAKDGKCTKDGGAYKIGGYSDVGRGQVAALQKAVTQQPTSVAVDASNWSAYKGGVFSGCGTSLNHGVLAVGFTADSWTIKNSWGTSWGEQGYMKLKLGNTCGVASQASYPIA